MSKNEKDVSISRGSSSTEDSPHKLVFLVISFLLPRDDRLPTEMVPSSVFWLPKAIPGACATQHAGCCCPCPLQALLGEASALGGGLFVAVAFPTTLGAGPSLSVRRRAQSRHEQQQNPEGEKPQPGGHQESCKRHKTGSKPENIQNFDAAIIRTRHIVVYV